MTHLFLLRHGIAVPSGTPEIPDEERTLTPKGERRVRQVAYGLGVMNLKVDRIVSSPLPRALRTAELVADVLGLTSIFDTDPALSADKNAASIREWLQTRTEERLMIVGHNPSFSDLLPLLLTGAPTPGFCELRKAGVAALRSREGGGWTLDWVAPPGLLRRLSR
jgi:phosphohistidine phosphatase